MPHSSVSYEQLGMRQLARGVKGAGLGLAMAQRIVDAHGGEIFCRSAVEQGTVFYIAIPVHWQRNP